MSLIYKPKQGIVIRRITFLCLLVLFTFGAYRLYSTCFPPAESIQYGWLSQPLTQITIPLVEYDIIISYRLFISLGIWLFSVLLSFWASFRHARLSEFLIETESEMRKVSWPIFREVVTSSVVVIITIIILGVFMFLSDIVFDKFFGTIF